MGIVGGEEIVLRIQDEQGRSHLTLLIVPSECANRFGTSTD